MAEEDKTKKAVAIDAAINSGDKLDQVLASLGALGEGMTTLGVGVDALSKRVDALESPGKPLDKELAADTARRDGMTSAEKAEAERKDSAELAEHQARADAVASSWGERAPKPLMGESPLDYRKRMLRHWQKYSPEFEKVNLDKLDPDAFPPIERRIYADALAASANPTAAAGALIPRTRILDTGHRVTTFYGDSAAFIHRFAPTKQVGYFVKPKAGG